MSDTRDRNLDGKSPDELERDIEETRERISQEMGELGYKLGPEGLRDSAGSALKDTQDTVVSVTEQLRKGVVESSDSIGGRVATFIKQNPVPATLFGIGLAWLLKQGQESGGHSGGPSRGYADSQSSNTQRFGSSQDGNRGGYRGGRSGSSSDTTSSSNTAGRTVVAHTPERGGGGSQRDTRTNTSTSGRGGTSSEDEAFRSHYESTYSADGDFEDYEDAYRYGFDLASEDTFAGKPWSDARSDVKRRWDDERNEPWFRYDQAVEHGYTTAQSRR